MGGSRTLRAVLCVLAVTLAGGAGVAQEQGQGRELGPVTKLPLPRYVSLRASEINVRRGPGLDYRIDWMFQRAGLPVRIVDEYNHWRRIADSDNSGGWVYHALLTSHRTALVTGAEVTLREDPSDGAPPAARAEQGVVAKLRQCRPDWCELEADGHRGWVRKTEIWGVDPDEVFGG
jgi:SH3-like domain-containing protein